MEVIEDKNLGISYTFGSNHFWISDGAGGNGAVEIRIEDIDKYIEAFNKIKMEAEGK